MNLRAPAAMLWENWRLTRVEAGQRLALGLLVGGAAMGWFDGGATTAFWVIAFLYSMIWFSIAKLNGGRFMDGYKPGFPFHLLYTRPVPTWLIVGVALAYDVISSVALYLLSAVILGLAFGHSLPLLPMILWLTAGHLAYACVQWSTSSRTVQWVGSIAFGLPLFLLLRNRLDPALQVHFTLPDYVFMVVLCVVSVGLTVAGVARQRRGDAVATSSKTGERAGGFPVWLVALFRFPCPTSSPARAQVWFELKSSGLPVLVIGLSVALVIFLAYALGIYVEFARYLALVATMFSVPVLLFQLGSNAFGIRRKQGRTYASSFEATQAIGTAHLGGMKAMVRTVCVLVALAVTLTSIWLSSSLLHAWGSWILEGNDAVPKFLESRRRFADAVSGLPGLRLLGLAVASALAVAGLIAWQAAREALKARYKRAVLLVEWLPVAWGLTIMLLALARQKAVAPELPVDLLIQATFWIAVAAVVAATVYFLWSGVAERLLSIRHAGATLLVAASLGAAWLTFLDSTGAQLASMPPMRLVAMLFPALLLLMAAFLAPWAFNRVRHA
jgi:hypothetical protein